MPHSGAVLSNTQETATGVSITFPALSLTETVIVCVPTDKAVYVPNVILVEPAVSNGCHVAAVSDLAEIPVIATLDQILYEPLP